MFNADIIVLCILDTASSCSIAPSLHELDAELAQYSDLLDMPQEPADESRDVRDLNERLVSPLSIETVTQLNDLLPRSSEDVDQFALRPTAASLGLNDAIKECLGAEPSESGHCCYSHIITPNSFAAQCSHLCSGFKQDCDE